MLSTNRNPRTYRIVGAQRQIDERETPHPRVDRGELGEKLRSWRTTNAGTDPFRRVLGPAGCGAPNPYNSLQHIMCAVPEGPVNPERMPVPDTAKMARNIKEVARFFGATVVGITELDQLYVYSHRARNNAAMGEKSGDPVNLPHRYAICLGFESDYEKFLANNSRIS
ncbi:MAG: cprA, partial [Deltaproteobacteria bacterium]|nr:cprA [Deltaproteobacteria bacterium]